MQNEQYWTVGKYLKLKVERKLEMLVVLTEKHRLVTL